LAKRIEVKRGMAAVFADGDKAHTRTIMLNYLTMIWARGAWWAIILLLLATFQAACAEPRRVLLLHSFGHAFSPWSDMAASFRTDLAKRSSEPLDIYELSYDMVRFKDSREEGPFVDYLSALFQGRKLDLIIPLGAPATYFLQRNRSSLFPGTPMLIAGAERRRIPISTLEANDATVELTLDLPAYVENVLRLRPETKNIVVVVGKSPVELYWLSEMRQSSEPFANRVSFTWLNDLPFDEMLKRVAALPPDSVILYYLVAEDAAGIPYSQDAALDALRDVATVPIFGIGDYQLDRGIIGGPLMQTRKLGQQAASVALRMLRGEKPSEITSLPVGFGAPVYDWRELRRWDIDEGRLPSDNIVRFREPTVWERYRWLILLSAFALLAQTSMISFGLVQGRKRRQAEFSLKESEDRMTSTAASANVGLWQYNRTTDKMWATEHCRAMLGLKSDTPLTRETFLSAVHSEDRSAAVERLQAILKGGKSIGADIRIVHPDGQIRWVRARAHTDAQRTPDQLSGMLADITAQKVAEFEAERRREEVTHLTRVTVMGELSGAIAHEVNQPLTAILSNAQAALYLLRPESPHYSEIHDALSDIVREDHRARDVIQRLRGLLKKGDAKLEPVDLNQLVDSTTTLLRRELIERQIKAETDLEAGLPVVFGDAVQLQQVLLNLILNAVDSMASTPVQQRQVQISTRAMPAGTVEVTVKDNGPGIKPSGGTKLFEPFYTTKEHGLGLGLSICSTILEKHGGMIVLRNDDAGGAIAEFSLPAHVMLIAPQ
jgi:signal transduction histidine kinase